MSSRRSLISPHRIFDNFLTDELATSLLNYALTCRHDFHATSIRDGYDPTIRVSQRLFLDDTFKKALTDKIGSCTADFIHALRVSPFQPDGIELELVAHGNGAFYKRHIDTATGKLEAARRIRLISAVLYLHNTPRAFSGGALRLYSLGPDDTTAAYTDIAPTHNSLVIFPSWVPHSVEAVSCPSGAFTDARFAVNAWLWREYPNRQQQNADDSR